MVAAEQSVHLTALRVVGVNIPHAQLSKFESYLSKTAAGNASRWADCSAERCRMVDSQGRKWEVMEREDGSVVCYYTRAGDSAHWVVWDSLDRRPTTRAADLATGAQEYHRCETCGTLLRVLFRGTQNH